MSNPTAVSDREALARFKENHPDLQSVHEIARLPEDVFVERYADFFSCDLRQARRVHRFAVHLSEQVSVVWANIKDAASPHLRGTLFNNIPPEFLEHQQNIPGYDRLFGKLDFIECHHARSILGPAAYFVDLLRFVQRHIENPDIPERLKLFGRRPDLPKIQLTRENTFDLVPYIDLVIEILEAIISTRADRDANAVVAEAGFPMNLPFDLPLAEIRRYLEELGTNLHHIYQVAGGPRLMAGGPDVHHLDREFLGLSPREYALVIREASDESDINARYDLPRFQLTELGLEELVLLLARQLREGGRTEEEIADEVERVRTVLDKLTNRQFRKSDDSDARSRFTEALRNLDGYDEISAHEQTIVEHAEEDLSNVRFFMEQTGLTRTELNDLVYQDLDRHEVNAGLSRPFFINSVADGLGPMAIEQHSDFPRDPSYDSERLINLSLLKLDRIYRFLKLARALEWSFADLDWALRSLVPPYEPEPCLSFDGVTDFVSGSTDTEDIVSDSFTIEAWVLPSRSAINPVFTKGLSGPDTSRIRVHLSLFVDDDNHLAFYNDQIPDTSVGDEAVEAERYIRSRHQVATGVFSHVAASVEGNEVRFYINGNPAGTVYPAGLAPGEDPSIDLFAFDDSETRALGTPLEVGRDLGDCCYAGLIKDVRLWKGVRTLQEIRENRFRRLTGQEDDLVGYWPLVETHTGQLDDWTDNEQHLLPGDSGYLQQPTWLQADLVLDPLPRIRAYLFNGVDQFLARENITGAGGLSSLTIETWVEVSELRESCVVFLGDPSNGLTLYLGISEEGHLVFFFSLEGQVHHVRSEQILVPGEAAHVVMTVSEAGPQGYIDGVSTTLVETAPGDFDPPTMVQGIVVGGVNARFFSGAIWELRIWNVIRSPEALRRQRLRALPVNDRHGLIGYWPLDRIEIVETGGVEKPIASDQSPNHNNLFLGGVLETFMPERVNISQLPGATPVDVSGTILDFDGDNDVIRLTNEDGSGLGRFDRFTLELWFRVADAKRTNADGRNAEQVLYTQGDEEAGITVYVSDGVLTVYTWCAEFGGAHLRDVTVVSDRLTSRRWYHLAVVHEESNLDGSANLAAYLDGDLIAQRSDSFPLSPVGSAYLGGVGYVQGTTRTSSGIIDKRTRHFAHYFEGQITDFRLWSKAKDPLAIREGRFTAPAADAEHLVTYLPIDEATGRAVVDHARSAGRCTSVHTVGNIQRRNVAGLTEDTVSDLENVFSHYVGSGYDVLAWKDYVYVGKFSVSDEDSGIGVTFLSRYPDLEDRFYWIRRSAQHPAFYLSPYPRTGRKLDGTTDSKIVPTPGQQYRFRIEIRDVPGEGAPGRTEIKAKIWEDDSAEPAAYAIDAVDDSADRLASGTVGLWSFGPGEKRFDDLTLYTGETEGQEGAIRLLDETVEAYETGEGPVGWIDTSARVLHHAEADLFAVDQVVTDTVLYTADERDDVHAHYAPLPDDVDTRNWTNYEYSGRMHVTDARGGVGVTFFSGFPNDTSYYRLFKAEHTNRFGLGAVGARLGREEHTVDEVRADSDTWYWFRIRVLYEPNGPDGEGATTIRVRVWEEGTDEPEGFQLEVEDDRRALKAGTVGVWAAGPGKKYYDNLRVVRYGEEEGDEEIVFVEEFDAYTDGDTPTSWYSSGPHFSTSESRGLFHVRRLGNKVFGARRDLVAENAHTHYMPANHDVLNWRNLVYTGRMFVGADASNIGVTCYSRYPEAEDRYYILRRTAHRPAFHLAVHPEGIDVLRGMDSDAEIETEPGTWYRFRLVVRSHLTENGDGYTAIQARVWKDGDVEPEGYQLAATDTSSARIDAGAVGVWSERGDVAYVDDLRVWRDVLPQEDFEGYSTGDIPAVWMVDGGALSVVDLGGQKVLGVSETGPSPLRATARTSASAVRDLSQYEYTGKLQITDPAGGIGVTFFDQSGQDGASYTLTRESDVGAPFRLESHPDNRFSSHVADTDVIPEVGSWYSFRILVEYVAERRPRHDERGATFIKVKIWKSTNPEPDGYQIERVDHHRPIEFGTVGIWADGSGDKYFDELYASRLFPLFDRDFEQYEVGERPTGWVDTATRSRFAPDDTLLQTREYEDNRPGWTTSDDYPVLLNPRALRFGGREYMAAADVGDSPLSHFTIEALVMVGGDEDSATPAAIVSQANSLERQTDFWFGLDSDGRLTLVNVSAGTFVSGSVLLPADDFVRVAVAVEESAITFFINGEADPAGTQSLADPVQLGDGDIEVGRYTNEAYFKGLIQEITLWKTARDGDAMQDAGYIGPVQLIARYGADMLAYWPLLESDGLWTEDFSATSPEDGYHLRLGGLQGARAPQLVDDPWRPEPPFWRPENEALVFDGAFHTLFREGFQTGEALQRRTVEVLFTVNDVNLSSRRQVMYQEGDAESGVIIYVYAGRVYFGGYADADWSGTWIDAGRIQSDRWHHAAVVLDARKEMRPTAFRAFLDGRLIDVGPGMQIVDHPGFFALGGPGLEVRFHDGTVGGAISNGDHHFSGQIRELRIWDTARTADELRAYRFYVEDEFPVGERLEEGREHLTLWWSADRGFGEYGNLTERLTTIDVLPVYPLPETALDANALAALAAIRRLSARHDLSVDRLASLWYEINHTGREDGRTLFDQVFNEDTDSNLDRWPYFMQPVRWDVTGSGNLRRDRFLRSRLMSSLRVSSDALTALVERISGEGATTVLLDGEYLTHLYRLAQLPRTFRLTDAELVRLLELMALQRVDTLAALEAVSEHLALLSSIGLTIAEWDLFTNDVQSDGASITLDEIGIRELSDELRSQLADFTLRPDVFISERLSQADSRRIYEFLGSHGYLVDIEIADDGIANVVGAVTSAYSHPTSDAELETLADQFAELTGPSGLDWATPFRAMGDDLFLRLRNAGIVDDRGFVTVVDPESYSDASLREILGASVSSMTIGHIRETIVQRWESQSALGNILVERRGILEQTVVVALSNMFDSDSDVTRVVIQALADEMTGPEFLSLMLGIREGEALPEQIAAIPVGYLYRVGKLLALIGHFELTPEEAELLLAEPQSFSVRHPLNPEFDELRFLAGYKDLRSTAANPATLIEVLTTTPRYDTEMSDEARGEIMDAVSEAMGWDRSQLGEIVDHFGHDAPFNRIPGMIRLKDVFDLTGQLGSDVGLVIQLADTEDLTFEVHRQRANVLRDVLRAAHEGDQWTRVARSIHDDLAVRVRDALLSLAMLEISAEFTARRDADLLYEYLLIDVKTGSEVDASRIQQAIASVQLYVQRCLMNLERGVKPETVPDDQWEWMKNYRVWEANRKVFLFPENFIEPELRDTKTPLFEDLEQELMQSDIDAPAVESAYVNYLDRFTEIANLKIVGSYLHRAGGPGDGLDGTDDASIEETLYLVGRTSSDPTVFYYREHRRNRHGGRWLPWNKIDHAIKADFVTPVFAFGKLFLFWPDFTKIRKTVERRASAHLRNTYGVTFLNEVFTKPVTDAEIAALTNQRNQLRELIRLFPWLQPFYQPQLDAVTAQLNATVDRRNRQNAARADMEGELTSDEMRRLEDKRVEFDDEGYLFNKTTGAREQAAIDVYNTTIRYTYLNLSGAWVQPQVYADLENELTTEMYRRPEWQRLYAQQTVQLVTKAGGGRREETVRVLIVQPETDVRVSVEDLDTRHLTWSLWTHYENQAPGGWPGWHFDFDVPPGTDPQDDLEAFAKQLVDLTPTQVDRSSIQKTVSLLDYAQGELRLTAENVLEEVEGAEMRVGDAVTVSAEIRDARIKVYANQFTVGAGLFDSAATRASEASFQKASTVAAKAREAANAARTAQETVDQLEKAKSEGADDRDIELLEQAVARASETARAKADDANDEAQLARVLEQLQPRWTSRQVRVTVIVDGESRLTADVDYEAWQHISLTMDRGEGDYATVLRVFDSLKETESRNEQVVVREPLSQEGEVRLRQEEIPDPDSVNAFRTLMSDVRLWSLVLDEDAITSGRHTRLRGEEPNLAMYLPLNIEPLDATVQLIEVTDLEFLLPPVQLVRERIILIYGHQNTVKSIRNNIDDKSIVLDLVRSDQPVLHDLMLSRETGITLESSKAVLHLRETNGLEFRDYASGDPTVPIFAPVNPSPSAVERANYLVHRLKEAESSFMDVHNRPGWAILDSGDEQFLIKAVYFDDGDPPGELPVPTTRDRMQVTFSDEGGQGEGTPQALSVSFVPVVDDPLDGSAGLPIFTFERLGTFHVHRLSENLFTGGIDKLLSIESQEAEEPEVDFQAVYDPNPGLIPFNLNRLRSSIDFRGAYREYYEEVFFHIPFLIANQLNANQRFSEAQKWYHYIFNPTTRSSDEVLRDQRDRYWQYLPFRRFSEAENLVDLISDDAALADYREDPFDPHAIARLRIFAYQKAVVMKYIDNLLDWGDALFRRDTRESINEAVSLYVMAFNLLGPRPRGKTVRSLDAVGDYDDVRNAYDGSELPDFIVPVSGGVDGATAIGSAGTSFCTVENDHFLGFWDRVEDRLFKIRHSLNIEGVFRQLALFEPPISPAELVRAVAGGRDVSGALSDLAVPVPHYRYGFMLEKAKEMIGNVIELGGALLSVLEKRDAEQLAVLENTHERNVLEMMTSIKEQERDEAVTAIEALTKSREAINEKHARLGRLIDENLTPEEKAAIILFGVGNGLKIASSVLKFASSVVYTVPDVTAGGAGAFGSPVAVTTFGGGKIAEGLAAAADVVDIVGSATVLAGDITEKVAVYNRRRGEWEHERSIAGIELEEIDLQIEMAQMRRARAEQELAVHAKSIEQNREVGDFHRRKFSNQALYNWMVAKTSGLYFQAYQLAFDMAKSAEKALQFELPSTETFVNFGHWDSLKKGLLAAEALRLEVGRMEKSHLEQDSRFLEIEKTVSLADVSPDSLDLLISDGECEFELSELVFDRDHPGHYFRVIKTIAVSIVLPPGTVTSVNATLTQLGSRALLVPDENAVRYLLGEEGADQPPANVLRSNWRANQQIAISSTSEDDGMFVLNFFLDDRYFPFEGTGAVSTWLLEMPHVTNPGIDFTGIQDVLIHLRYTAKSDSGAFKDAVMGMI